MSKKLPVLISIPHGGLDIPSELVEKTALNRRDIFEDGDALTPALYDLGDRVEVVVTASVARAFVDLNRSPEDRPPANPDGVVKTRTVYGQQIYQSKMGLEDSLIQSLLDRYYHPYHDCLETRSKQGGLALGLDCHSMLPHAPPGSLDAGTRRPMICLSNRGGADGNADPDFPKLSCGSESVRRLADCFQISFNVSKTDVQINHPFHGGFITARHGLNPVPFIQVEINRALYLTRPWFDKQRLQVDPKRISWLRECFHGALSLFFKPI